MILCCQTPTGWRIQYVACAICKHDVQAHFSQFELRYKILTSDQDPNLGIGLDRFCYIHACYLRSPRHVASPSNVLANQPPPPPPFAWHSDLRYSTIHISTEKSLVTILLCSQGNFRSICAFWFVILNHPVGSWGWHIDSCRLFANG